MKLSSLKDPGGEKIVKILVGNKLRLRSSQIKTFQNNLGQGNEKKY